MFLGKKPTRLAPAAKSRLNTHPHNLDIDAGRKKSPDGSSHPPGPPSPSEVLVFDTRHGGSSRAGHYNATLPEVPDIEAIQQFMKDNWEEQMARIKDPKNKLNVLWIKSFAEEEREREEAAKAAAGAVGGSTPGPVSFASAVAASSSNTSASSSNHLSRTNSTSPSSPASASSSASSTPTASSSSTQPKPKSFSPQHIKRGGNVR